MLFSAFAYGIMGIGGVMLALSTTGSWSTFGWCDAVLGGSLWFVLVVKFLLETHADYVDRITDARNRTPQSHLADKIHNLDVDKVSLVRNFSDISIGVKPDIHGPRYTVGRTEIPIEFIDEEFIPRCTMDSQMVTHTAKISDWPDGKIYRGGAQCRTLARETIQYLVDLKWAVWWNGNQSGKLVNLNALELRTAFGLQIEP